MTYSKFNKTLQTTKKSTTPAACKLCFFQLFLAKVKIRFLCKISLFLETASSSFVRKKQLSSRSSPLSLQPLHPLPTFRFPYCVLPTSKKITPALTLNVDLHKKSLQPPPIPKIQLLSPPITDWELQICIQFK